MGYQLSFTLGVGFGDGVVGVRGGVVLSDGCGVGVTVSSGGFSGYEKKRIITTIIFFLFF